MKLVTLLPPLACGAMMLIMTKKVMGGGPTPEGADAQGEAPRELERLRAERDRLEWVTTDG